MNPLILEMLLASGAEPTVIGVGTTPGLGLYEPRGNQLGNLTNPTNPGSNFIRLAVSPDSQMVTICQNGVSNGFVNYTIPFAALPDQLPNVPAGFCTNLPSASWRPDSAFLAVAGSAAPYLQVYSRTGTTFVKVAEPPVSIGERVTAIAWSPDGSMLCAGTIGGSVLLFAFDGEDLIAATLTGLQLSTQASDIFWSPDGSLIAACASTSDNVKFYKVTAGSGDYLKQLSFGATAGGCSFSSDGSLFAVAHSDGLSMYSVDGEDFTLLTDPLTPAPSTVNRCRFTAGAEYLVTRENNVPCAYRRTGQASFVKLSNPSTLPSFLADVSPLPVGLPGSG